MSKSALVELVGDIEKYLGVEVHVRLKKFWSEHPEVMGNYFVRDILALVPEKLAEIEGVGKGTANVLKDLQAKILKKGLGVLFFYRYDCHMVVDGKKNMSFMHFPAQTVLDDPEYPPLFKVMRQLGERIDFNDYAFDSIVVDKIISCRRELREYWRGSQAVVPVSLNVEEL